MFFSIKLVALYKWESGNGEGLERLLTQLFSIVSIRISTSILVSIVLSLIFGTTHTEPLAVCINSVSLMMFAEWSFSLSLSSVSLEEEGRRKGRRVEKGEGGVQEEG